MKIIIITSLFIFLVTKSYSQILRPVKWSTAVKKTSSKEAIVFFKATIDYGWHIYSTKQKTGGPVKTSFLFKSSTGFELNGGIMEPKTINIYDKAFNMQVKYFENGAVFYQKIHLKSPMTTVKVRLEFMSCNNHQCLPPEELRFAILIK